MSLESENKQLREENEQLHIALSENDADFRLLVNSIVEVMSAVGLSPKSLMSDENPIAIVGKALPNLLLDLSINQAKVEMQFAPLKELAPLLKKHEHLIESI